MSVIIYGKPGCTNCDKAKMLCNIKSIDYQYYTVGQDVTVEQLQEKVGTNVSTLPQIFVMSDGFAEYVGGYNEFRTRMS